jgi:hypothetical protein
MKTSSRKSKGRRLQNFVRDSVLESFPELTDEDARSAIMGETGCDLKLSMKARRQFPFSLEMKNQERLNVYAAFAQAQSNCLEGTMPLLVVKRNRQEPLAILLYSDFLKLFTGAYNAKED